MTDIEFAAKINHFAGVEGFVRAHSGAPWFVSMVGFVAGLPFLYQMVERKRQLQSPKYLRPRTDTPKLTIGHGGCFGCIYSVRGAGGYQMFGDHADADLRPQSRDQLSARLHVPVQSRRHRQMEADQREPNTTLVADVEAGSFAPTMRRRRLLARRVSRRHRRIQRRLEEALHGH